MKVQDWKRDFLDLMNDFLYPNYSKIYEKEPQYIEISL